MLTETETRLLEKLRRTPREFASEEHYEAYFAMLVQSFSDEEWDMLWPHLLEHMEEETLEGLHAVASAHSKPS